MSNNSHEITKAFWALGDYFSRLSGGARYLNMTESDIPLYIACQLAKKHSQSFVPERFVVSQFDEAASPVLKEVHAHLDCLSAEQDELARHIVEFVTYVDSKLKEDDRSTRWKDFCEWAIREYARPNTALLSLDVRQKITRPQ